MLYTSPIKLIKEVTFKLGPGLRPGGGTSKELDNI